MIVVEVVMMTMMENQELPEIVEVGGAEVADVAEVVDAAVVKGTPVGLLLATTVKNKVICLTNAQTQKLREN
jgi:hypothetical protein